MTCLGLNLTLNLLPQSNQDQEYQVTYNLMKDSLWEPYQEREYSFGWAVP